MPRETFDQWWHAYRILDTTMPKHPNPNKPAPNPKPRPQGGTKKGR